MIEIERKFLVKDKSLLKPERSSEIEQGYLMIEKDRSLRVRQKKGVYTMTFKAKIKGKTIARHELENEIEANQGRLALDQLCVTTPIRKVRHIITHAGKTWEVDEFFDANDGLIVAEVELPAEDEAIDLPEWVGPEVTEDGRFTNAALSEVPFKDWGVSYAKLLDECA